MRLHTILIKPASGLCNMQCDYCFYCDETIKREVQSYGMMSEETLKNIVKKAMFQARGEICFAFQGGEPTLRGLEFYKRVVELEERFNRNHVRVMNSFQTNGLNIDEAWCDFFYKHDFLVGVSVDGTKMIHDKYRHSRDGGPTYDKIRNSVRLLEEHGVQYNILTVVTSAVALNIKEIYQEYKRNGWKYQQYIACLDPLGEEPGTREYSLTPKLYGQFLIDLFKLWYKDWRRGKSPYIRQFENYIGIMLGMLPESCEQRGTCSIQCVTEADGSVYPCDFYVMDEYRLGNFNTGSVKDFFESEIGRDFVKDSRQLSEMCKDCQWYQLCRGGCRRHRIQDEDQYRSYFCEGYKMFFEQCAEQMREIAGYAASVRG